MTLGYLRRFNFFLRISDRLGDIGKTQSPEAQAVLDLYYSLRVAAARIVRLHFPHTHTHTHPHTHTCLQGYEPLVSSLIANGYLNAPQSYFMDDATKLLASMFLYGAEPQTKESTETVSRTLALLPTAMHFVQFQVGFIRTG